MEVSRVSRVRQVLRALDPRKVTRDYYYAQWLQKVALKVHSSFESTDENLLHYAKSEPSQARLDSTSSGDGARAEGSRETAIYYGQPSPY